MNHDPEGRLRSWLDRGYRWAVALLAITIVAWIALTAVGVTLLFQEKLEAELGIRVLVTMLSTLSLAALMVHLAGLLLRAQQRSREAQLEIVAMLSRFASGGVDYARGYADAMEHKTNTSHLRSIQDR